MTWDLRKSPSAALILDRMSSSALLISDTPRHVLVEFSLFVISSECLCHDFNRKTSEANK